MYNGEQIWLTASDGCKLDAMIIHKPSDSSSNVIHDNNNEMGPTVIFCNPNAGYYEYSYDLQEQWMDFYTTRGLNVMLWNYRGYGRSQGRPVPKKILEDGECVVRYLREERKVQKLILHGESLGGAVATYLAWKCGCDFLFADRTFSSLDSVASVSLGKFAEKLFRLLTGWNFNCTQNFIQSPCYKVMGNDPCDGTIHELSSLKTAISADVIKNPNRSSDDATSKISTLSSSAVPISAASAPCNENAPHILSLEEIYNFDKYLHDLHEIVKNPAKSEHSKKTLLLRNTEGKVDDDGLPETPVSQKERGGELILVMPKNTNSARNVPILHTVENHTRLPKDYYRIDDSDAAVLAKNVLSELDEIDGAGVTLGRIMKDYDCYHYELLKAFAINLDVWGSHPPSKIVSSYQPVPRLSELRIKAMVYFRI